MQCIARGFLAIRFGDWAAPFGIVFVADALAAAMVAITGILAAAVMTFGLADIRRCEEQAGFHPLLLGMLAGVNGAFLTGDIFNLYVWFEVMLITAMGLLAIGRNRAQLDATVRYAILNLFSTLLFLTGVALLYGATGTLNMSDLARVLPQTEPSINLTLSALLLLCGFGIKAGYFPLFFWLPASYHTASITVSAIFAGLLTKVGVYACLRVFTLIFSVEDSGIREIVAVLAAGTMLFGVFGAAVQWDVRRILSFHIVSQIGYMLLGLAISTQAALTGAIFYILHHIIMKANLFPPRQRHLRPAQERRPDVPQPAAGGAVPDPGLVAGRLAAAVGVLGQVPGDRCHLPRWRALAGGAGPVRRPADALFDDQDLDGGVLEEASAATGRGPPGALADAAGDRRAR